MPAHKLSPEDIEWLKANFRAYSLNEIAARFSIDHSSVCYHLKKYGLKKSKEDKAAIMKRTAVLGEPRIFDATDNYGTMHRWITFGAGRTMRYSHYLLQQAGIPVNNRLRQVIFTDGNPLNCTLENIEVVTRARYRKIKAGPTEPKPKGRPRTRPKTERVPRKTTRRPKAETPVILPTPARQAERATALKTLKKSNNKRERQFAERMKEKPLEIKTDFTQGRYVRINAKTWVLVKPAKTA